MKPLKNTKECREKQIQVEIDLLNQELSNPDNFIFNKYAKEAENDIVIKDIVIKKEDN